MAYCFNAIFLSPCDASNVIFDCRTFIRLATELWKQNSLGPSQCQEIYLGGVYDNKTRQCHPSYTVKYFCNWQSGLQMVANQKCDWCQFHWLRGYLDVATAPFWNWQKSHVQLATKTGIKNCENLLPVKLGVHLHVMAFNLLTFTKVRRAVKIQTYRILFI